MKTICKISVESVNEIPECIYLNGSLNEKFFPVVLHKVLQRCASLGATRMSE